MSDARLDPTTHGRRTRRPPAPSSFACPPHTRTPPAGPDPRRSSPRWRPVPEGEAALQQLARRRRWHGASDSDLVSHRCPSNPHPLGRPQASPSPPKRSVPAAWHQGSREDGCSSGRRAGSARRLRPLKPSASTPLIYRLSCLPNSLLFPSNFLRSQVAWLRCTAEGVLHFSRCSIINGPRRLEPITPCSSCSLSCFPM